MPRVIIAKKGDVKWESCRCTSVTPLAPGYTVLPITVFDWASRPQADFQGIAAAAIIVILAIMVILNALALVLRVRLSKNIQW